MAKRLPTRFDILPGWLAEPAAEGCYIYKPDSERIAIYDTDFNCLRLFHINNLLGTSITEVPFKGSLLCAMLLTYLKIQEPK